MAKLFERVFESAPALPGETPLWLKLIWRANDISGDFFGAPILEDHGNVEIYRHARVTHGGGKTTIRATSPEGDDVLKRAAEILEQEVQ